MNDDELLEIAAKLEAISDKEVAKSRLEIGKPAEMLFLRANRPALIQFAAGFLRAAAAPLDRNDGLDSKPFEFAHHQICESETDRLLAPVRRVDELPENPEIFAERRRQAQKGNFPALLGCGIVCCLLGFVIWGLIAYLWNAIIGIPLN